MTEISFKLERNSIQKAIRELENYTDGLKEKCELLCKELRNKGIEVAQEQINESPLRTTITLKSEISKEEAGCQAILIAIGTVTQTGEYPPFNTLLAVEFGAGIHYNHDNNNPRAEDFGMGVGTFPVLEGHVSHALDDNGWYYMGNDGEWHHSSGVKATMPMYRASMKIQESIAESAKKIFGGK